jgi:hypothetical protein
MIQSNKLNKAVIVSASILALSGIVLAAVGTAPPAPAAEDPLKLIPADSMFCVRINDPNGLLGQTDLFLTGLSPMSISMLAKAQLGQLLGNPEPAGLNMSGSFALFGPLTDGNNVGIGGVALLIPVTDYSRFISGNPNVKPPNDQGISTIGAREEGATASVIQLDAYALAGVRVSDQALLAMKKTMTAAMTRLETNLDPAELKKAQTAPVWAYLNVPAVAKKYGPMLKSAMQGLKGATGAMQGPNVNAAGKAQAEMAVDMYASMLDSLMNETRFVSLSLEPSATALRAAVTVAALPETQMADMLKGAPSKLDAKMLNYFRDGAAMNFAFSLDPAKWSKLNALYVDMMLKFMGKSLSPESAEALKKMALDSTEAVGGTIVGSIAVDTENKPPFDIRYVAALKDQAKFNQVLDEVAKMMNPGGALADLYKEMGIRMTVDLKRKAADYKGVDIDSMRFSVAMTDANSPEKKAIAAMYGNGITVQMAATNGFLVYVMASDPNAAIREMINQVKAGGPAKMPSEAQNALQLIPGAEKGSLCVTLNVLRLMQMVAAMAPTPMPVPQAPAASPSDVALAGTCGDGKVSMEVAVPKQQVMEIMGAAMQMQQQKMQKQMQQQGTQPEETQPQPTPPQPQQTPAQPPQVMVEPAAPEKTVSRGTAGTAGTASYTIDIRVQFSSTITQGSNRLMVELRQGVPGTSSVFDTKYFEGQTATVSFSNMPAGSYFVAIGNGDSVAVGPVRQFNDGQRVRTTMRVTYSSGNVGTRSRKNL